MRKSLLILALISTPTFADQSVDIAMSRVNASLKTANAAAPSFATQIGDSQNAWSAWAQRDCKARYGLPLNKEASLHDKAFGTCMAEQMNRRADQLFQYACATNQHYCQ